MGAEVGREDSYLSNSNSDFKSFAISAIEFMDELDAPTEADTKVKVVTPFLEQLGWSQYSTQFRMEYTPVGGLSHRTDYLLLSDSGEPLICIEAKRWRSTIGTNEITQIKDYLRIYNLQYGILTNGYNFLFFIQPDTDSIEVPDPIRRTLDEISLDQEFIEPFKHRDGDNRDSLIPSSKWWKGTPEFFYEEVLVQDDQYAIPADILVDVYNNIAVETGQDQISHQDFWRKMYETGLERSHKKRSRTLTPGREREVCLDGYRFSKIALNHLGEHHKEHPSISSIIDSIHD
jgi:hypothetical protein